MKIGFIGLGKMGANMVRRLANKGVTVFGFDVDKTVGTQLATENKNIHAASSVTELVQLLGVPRVLWTMLPAGEISQQTFSQLKGLLSAGDLVVDGANAFYKDSQRYAKELAEAHIAFIDAGVSGGVWGLKNGYTIMFGGTREAAALVKPFVERLAPTQTEGWLHCGPVGSGHFTKMVHNGIEYGMMQAFSEGFALLKAKEEFNLSLSSISEVWRHGSVIRSWLLDLIADTLKKDSELTHVQPIVPDSGEGRWTVSEAIDLGTPALVIAVSLFQRYSSQGGGHYAAKLLSMMRHAFGGHAVAKE